MDLQTLIPLVVQGSLFLLVFVIGLRADMQHAAYLFRRPGELARALFAMNVVMPLFAVALVLAFDLTPVVKFALVALSISPIPPIRPMRIMGAGGTDSYAVGLLIAVSVLSIVLVPLSIAILGRVFNIPLEMGPAAVATLIFVTVLAPIGLGMAVHKFAPVLAERLQRPLVLLAAVGVLTCIIAILYVAAPAMWTLIGNGTVIAFASFVVVGLAVGHFLGGPQPEKRFALAISTPSRNPGIALGIAAVNFPQEKLVFAAVLIYILTDLILSVLYRLLTRGLRSRVADHAEAGRT